MQQRFNNLNGIRALASIGIVMFHIPLNATYNIPGLFYHRFVPSFLYFVLLFMVISAFSMCCGYHSRFKAGKVDLNAFYKKRLWHILPLFALVATADLLWKPSLNNAMEWFADVTFNFGFIPNHNINVVGVGWFVGLILAFYFLFPYFVFLTYTKRRTWFSFFVALALHYLCYARFHDAITRTNIVYSAVFFFAGALIYHYREWLTSLPKLGKALLTLATLAMGYHFFVFNNSSYMSLVFFSLVVSASVSLNGKVSQVLLQNKPLVFVGGLSMEVYLMHMPAFRLVEKLHLTHPFKNDLASYLAVCALTVGLALVGGTLYQKAMQALSIWLKKKKTSCA